MTTAEKLRVLVVDDDHSTTTLISAVLDHDYSVDIAMDGAAAVEKLKRGSYAAILLDLRMPLSDGYEVLDSLGPPPARNVIIVTGSLMKREIERVKSYAPFALVRKPFDVEELLRTVHACTGRAGGLPIGGLFSSGVALLFAELLRQKWM